MAPPSKTEQVKRKDAFKSITACNSEEAAQYLDACNWDLNRAVELFFNSAPEGAGTRKRKEPIRQNGRQSNGAGPSSRMDVVTVSDDDDYDSDADSFFNETNEEPKASKMKANGGPSRALTKPVPEVSIDEDDVRAPMSFRSGPIVQQSFAEQYGNGIQARRTAGFAGAFDGAQDYRALAAQQKATLTARVKGGADSSMASGARTASKPADKSRSLQELFRPPLDILHAGDWESAKAASIERGCWVLVNVQDMREFPSQTLNRDVWSNPGLKELVKSNFLFWQVNLDSPDGQRMRNYYGVQTCPAVFIVDPRTGEKVTEVPLRSQEAVSVCDSLTRFMDDFPDFATRDRSLVGQVAPLDAEPQPDEAQSMEDMVAEPACSSNGIGRKRKADGDEGMNGKRSKVMDERSWEGRNGKGMDRDMDRLLEEGTRGLTMCDEDEWKTHVVPGGEPTKVMLRFPDGSRHGVELTGSTRLFALYQYIRGRGLMPEDHLFVLSYPKREYTVDQSEESLSQLGFSRSEMVHVETKE